MKKTKPIIGVFTSARSDYGHLSPLIRQLQKWLQVDLLVTGSHFSSAKGYTFQEILGEKLLPEEQIIQIPCFLDCTSEEALGKSIGLAQISFSQLLARKSYDGLVVLGDRFDLFGISVPAMLFSVPLFHISGGEITEGVIDDSVRHAHTKLAHIHLVAARDYAKNVSRMGEEDWRIVIGGEGGLDELYHFKKSDPRVIQRDFGVDFHRKLFLITYHPTSLGGQEDSKKQLNALFKTLKAFPDRQKIFTAPAFETGADWIETNIQEFVKREPHAIFVRNFGRQHYLTVMSQAEMVIGNSSSGIVEAPSFGVPTLNIGDRQKNRLAGPSIFSPAGTAEAMKEAIALALKPGKKQKYLSCTNPYDPYKDGRNSERMAFAIQKALTGYSKATLLRKKFVSTVDSSAWNTLLTGF